MTKTSLIVVAALAMALTACSNEPTPDESGRSEAAMQERAGDTRPVPAQTIEETAIPELLRGRWGLVPVDCTSTRGDAKGLMTVGAAKIEFYESVASLGPIKEIASDSISAAYEFTGEGQTWILDVTLSTPDGGKTLVRQDTGPDALPDPLTYTKCS